MVIEDVAGLMMELTIWYLQWAGISKKVNRVRSYAEYLPEYWLDA